MLEHNYRIEWELRHNPNFPEPMEYTPKHVEAILSDFKTLLCKSGITHQPEGESLPISLKSASIDKIKDCVCTVFDITTEELAQKFDFARTPNRISIPQSVFCFMARVLTDKTYKEIGKCINRSGRTAENSTQKGIDGLTNHEIRSKFDKVVWNLKEKGIVFPENWRYIIYTKSYKRFKQSNNN